MACVDIACIYFICRVTIHSLLGHVVVVLITTRLTDFERMPMRAMIWGTMGLLWCGVVYGQPATASFAMAGKSQPARSAAVPAKKTRAAQPAQATRPVRRASPLQTIRSHFGDVHDCYAAVALKDPSVAGRVTLQWTIGKSGMPQAVAVIKNTLKDKSVGACLKQRAKNWQFPPPVGGVQVISYPFDLRVR
jgi:hypothetical protein